jgi:adenosylhomocysteinase
MKDGAILANAGHFDVEIDLDTLSKLAVSRKQIRPALEEFAMDDGRRLFVLAEGRLVNLAAAEGHPADVMDMSFANQALAAEWILDNKAKLESKVYRLPADLDQEVATLKLAALGGGLELLTPEQESYMVSWRQGT